MKKEKICNLCGKTNTEQGDNHKACEDYEAWQADRQEVKNA